MERDEKQAKCWDSFHNDIVASVKIFEQKPFVSRTNEFISKSIIIATGIHKLGG